MPHTPEPVQPHPPGGLRQFVAEAGWNDTTAPEYAKLPHAYTVRGKATAGKEAPPVEWHDWFASQIQQHGYKKVFTNPHTGRSFPYVYLHVDGFKYWAFETIINREPLAADTVELEVGS